MQYLKQDYLYMLKKDTSENYNTVASCCKRGIKNMKENGVSTINNYKTILNWNRTYCLDEVFPHPNINIQIGQTYQSEFLEAHPEVQIMINKWSNQNLDQLSCENVAIFIRNNILPKIYTTYLSEDCDSGDKPLSQSEFL